MPDCMPEMVLGLDCMPEIVAASPLRDRSNENEVVGRPSPKKSGPDGQPISFEEMRKQLSYWQSQLQNLNEQKIEADVLRQDSSSLRGKLASCEEEASERAQRLAEIQVQNQEQARELAEMDEKVTQQHIELAQEKEVSERQKRELRELLDVQKDSDRRRVGLEAEAASLKAELCAERVQGSRTRSHNEELEAEVARAKAAAQAQVAEAEHYGGQVARMQQDLSTEQDLSEKRLLALRQFEETCSSLQAERETSRLDAERKQEEEAQRELALEADARALRCDLEVERDQSDRQRQEIASLEAEVAELAVEMEAQTASQLQELEAERELSAELAMAQSVQLQELQSSSEGLQVQKEESCARLEDQLRQQEQLLHQRLAESQEVQVLLQEARNQVEQQKAAVKTTEARAAATAQSLEAERSVLHSEVARLSSLESSLRTALDGQCAQLASSAKETSELRRRFQDAEQARNESEQKQEELELELQGEAQANDEQLEVLTSELSQLRATLEASEADSKLWQDRAEALVRRRRAAAAAASRWEGADAAWSWLQEDNGGAQSIEDLPEGSELRLQNRELCLSLRQFKQDCELLEAENLSLLEAVNVVEDDLDRVSGQHAQLIGHVNHRQKIRYTMKLKEENNRLCMELKKARQRIIQLEVTRETESLLEALASVGFLGQGGLERSPPARSPATLGRLPLRLALTQGTPKPAPRPSANSARRTPCATPGALSQRSGRGAGPATPCLEDWEDQVRLEEAERRCELQQHALERISIDFQHLKALMERAVLLADTDRRNGSHGGNFAALLERLREIIQEGHRLRNFAAVESASMDQLEPNSIPFDEPPTLTTEFPDDHDELLIDISVAGDGGA
mmetsp:Transcript_42412/g.76634  ORF Transcript_42412/g.76634 Transcript_42412/m.76634 type:complete len:863 (-) Transcript_42412:382-2970(-)